MTGAVDRYRRAWRVVDDVAAGVRCDWGAASPCPGWTARHLAGHLIDGHHQIRAMLRHSGPPHPITEPAAWAVLAGSDPAAALRYTATTVDDDLAGLDATATISTARGQLRIEQVLTLALIEPVIHAWDLAQATGQKITLDEDAVRTLLAGVEQLGDQLAASGMYAPALRVPAGRSDTRSDTRRLLAAVGRRADREAGL
jgi:uncharacterized protein (TIGR03086 family)